MSQPPSQEQQRRRKGRKHATDQNGFDDSAQTDEGSVKSRPRSNNKKKQESTLTQGLVAANGSLTPPRNSDNAAHNADGQKSTRKGKKNTQQGQQNSTPGPNKNRHHSGTPKQVAMDAYAGPTFHASPAPSALPIPRMFSKSAPAAEKDVGITARLQREEGSTSSGSDGSPDSPSTRPSTRVASGGPAMFDFLLNADRQEKARQLQGQTLSPPQSNTRENSVSPVHAQTLHRPKHSRTLTDSELAHVPQQSSSPVAHRQIPHYQLGSPYANSTHQQQSTDGNLKRMLFSSPQQGQPVNSYYGGAPGQAQWNSSPASGASGSPYLSPASSNGLASSSRPAPVSPYTQASPSPSARRQVYSPYNNSNLRRELAPGTLHQTPPPLGDLPRYNSYNGSGSPLASPIQQRFGNRDSPYSGQGYAPPNRNPSPTGNRRFSAQDALNSLGGNTSGTTEMEDKLRQILKIGQLNPQGPHGQAVPS